MISTASHLCVGDYLGSYWYVLQKWCARLQGDTNSVTSI